MVSVYQRMLIALDDSSISRTALRHAVELARAQAAVLCVVHVVEDEEQRLDVSGVDIVDLEATRHQVGQGVIDEAMELVQASGVTGEPRLVPTHGRSISTTILDMAHEWEADLIVMGTRGRDGMSRLITHSVTEDVVHHGDVPVLLIPESAVPPK